MSRRLHTLGYILGFLGLLLAIVALLRVGGTNQRLTDVREELLMVAQGIRQNDIRSLSTRIEAVSTDLSKVSGDMRGLASAVQEARAEVSRVAKDLAALSAKVAAMNSARLETFAERLAQIEMRLADVEEAVAGVKAEQARVRTELSSWALRIGVVDAEDLFVRVFLPQVAAERSALQAKAQEIQDLQRKYAQGQIKQDAYQQQYAKLQAEYLQAQVRVNMSMLEKMIASPGFANLRADLQNLRDQAKPLADQVEGLVKQAQVTILNYTDFFSQLQQLESAFQQVDQLLTQVAAVKILEVAQQVGQEQGYHLVLRVKDVVMYAQVPIQNLTPLVEERLKLFFES